MRPISTITGTMVPLDRADVDTDQIMPKQFLKRIERTGFGEHLFHDWRQDPDFVLNDPARAGARVLVTGPNFGCGSSREHAPWGLQQYGFEAIVAPSFADIFKGNCAKIGLLAVEVEEQAVRALLDLAEADPDAVAHVDLPQQTVTAGDVAATFAIEPHTKHLLVEGLDDIGLTSAAEEGIAAHEAARPGWMPRAAV